MHKRRYRATDPGGARLVSGRYNRGLDRVPEGETFPALYLATAPEICLGEVYRLITPELLESLNDFSLSELSVSLQEIADCRDPSVLALTPEALSHDTNYRATLSLGVAANPLGLEGLFVPSATQSALLERALLAVPGLSRRSMCSPATWARMRLLTSLSRSRTSAFSSFSASRSFILVSLWTGIFCWIACMRLSSSNMGLWGVSQLERPENLHSRSPCG
jgi:hypothetical protein